MKIYDHKTYSSINLKIKIMEKNAVKIKIFLINKQNIQKYM